MGALVPQVPRDVSRRLVEHVRGEESGPGCPAAGGDGRRYGLTEEAAGSGAERGSPWLTAPLSAGGDGVLERWRLRGARGPPRPWRRMSAGCQAR